MGLDVYLTLSTTHEPATDLGYLLHKHPERCQTFEITAGNAHVFYPEATARRTTAALILDIDPISLVRGRRGSVPGEAGPGGGLLSQYVNDRPYVASSFLSVALNRVFGTALGGRCATRPELVDIAMPLEATFGPVRAGGGTEMILRLFEPLGYGVNIERTSPSGARESAECWDVTLAATLPLKQLLSHVYVLLPVLDNQKHYWVSQDEIDKLFRHGSDWLPAHPDRELIARRYLKHGRRLTRMAIERFAELDGLALSEESKAEATLEPDPISQDRAVRLHDARLEAVVEVIKDSGATSVLDLGCGEGKLLRHLLKIPRVEKIVGVDVSMQALALAKERLELDRMSEKQRGRLHLMQSALTYRDRRLTGFDAAALVEVVEHIDPDRLPAFESAVFGYAKPRLVVLTTPNREYNTAYSSLEAGTFRNRDHRFEWNREEFRIWSERVANENGYSVTFSGVGDVDADYGQPTQLAVFECI
jgi:3' terminal RNA ribose 2'-O-methyltransferase Hen1